MTLLCVIYVCFATAVNLGTLELTLLYDPVTAALTCSLHRAKVRATFNGYKLCMSVKLRSHIYTGFCTLCLGSKTYGHQWPFRSILQTEYIANRRQGKRIYIWVLLQLDNVLYKYKPNLFMIK